MLLPDINVWLAMTFDGHVHHPVARKWFDGLTSEVCLFCRFTQQGFLRIASNPTVFGNNALTLAGAWQTFDLLLADPRVSFVDEPAGVEQYWRAFTQRQSYSTNAWSDAYLAAFAQAAGFEIVTLDKGFARYAGLRHTILSASPGLGPQP
jgi:toxin-antitoxin system PIN domain toxin